MRRILAICREHGQPPAWWDGVPSDDQQLLLAEYQIRYEESKPKGKR